MGALPTSTPTIWEPQRPTGERAASSGAQGPGGLPSRQASSRSPVGLSSVTLSSGKEAESQPQLSREGGQSRRQVALCQPPRTHTSLDPGGCSGIRAEPVSGSFQGSCSDGNVSAPASKGRGAQVFGQRVTCCSESIFQMRLTLKTVDKTIESRPSVAGAKGQRQAP